MSRSLERDSVRANSLFCQPSAVAREVRATALSGTFLDADYAWTGLHTFDNNVSTNDTRIDTTDGAFTVGPSMAGSSATVGGTIDANVANTVSLDSSQLLRLEASGDVTVASKTSTSVSTANGAINVASAANDAAITSTAGAVTLAATAGTLNLNPTGDIDCASNTVTGVAAPSTATSLAPKGYVDGLVNALTHKTSVRVASTANFASLTGATPLVIDTINPVNDGDRVLLKNQTTNSENGIYEVDITGGTWTLNRASDMAAGDPIQATSVFVDEGGQETYAFVQVENSGIVDTNDMNFTPWLYGGAITTDSTLAIASDGTLSVNEANNFVWTGDHTYTAPSFTNNVIIDSTGATFLEFKQLPSGDNTDLPPGYPWIELANNGGLGQYVFKTVRLIYNVGTTYAVEQFPLDTDNDCVTICVTAQTFRTNWQIGRAQRLMKTFVNDGGAILTGTPPGPVDPAFTIDVGAPGVATIQFTVVGTTVRVEATADAVGNWAGIFHIEAWSTRKIV